MAVGKAAADATSFELVAIAGSPTNGSRGFGIAEPTPNPMARGKVASGIG